MFAVHLFFLVVLHITIFTSLQYSTLVCSEIILEGVLVSTMRALSIEREILVMDMTNIDEQY